MSWRKMQYIFKAGVALFMIVVASVTVAIMALSIRGMHGNPRDYDLLHDEWKDRGPFELSPERGRYALTYSLLENKSYAFSPYLAVFTSPDVAYWEGKYLSLFPPGLSYIVMPGYILGRMYGFAQIGTFAIIPLFACINGFLIYRLSRRFGAHPAASLIASLIFLFATPAYAYATTLYQHHVTTFLLLMAILLLTWSRHWFVLLIIWFISALAIVVDSPNIIFFLPVLIYAFSSLFGVIRNHYEHEVTFRLPAFLTILSFAIPITFLMYFNMQSYGNPFQLGGGVPRSTDVRLLTNENGTVYAESHTVEDASAGKEPVRFFKTRNAPNGIYELFFAMDRGVIYFTPVILLGILGLSPAMRRSSYTSSLLLASLASIVVLYSLWGDPYGGWAFGSRYLIPAYALFAPYLAVALTRYRREWLLVIMFIIFAAYSVAINTAGALTTNTNPPLSEILGMQMKYGSAPPVGYLKNFDEIRNGYSKSFAYNTYFRPHMNLQSYALTLFGSVLGLIVISTLWLIGSRRHKEEHEV